MFALAFDLNTEEKAYPRKVERNLKAVVHR